MKYIIELMSGKNIEANELQATEVDAAWQAKEDITVNGVVIATHQITSIWPYDIWRDAENERRARKGQPAIPGASKKLLELPEADKNRELSATGKLWLEAIKRNKSQVPYGKWEVVDGKLSETAQYATKPPTGIKVTKTSKSFSPHDFNKFKQVPGYKVINEEDNILEYTVRAI